MISNGWFDYERVCWRLKGKSTKPNAAAGVRSADACKTIFNVATAASFSSIRSYISTAKKQGKNVFDTLAYAFKERLFLPEKT